MNSFLRRRRAMMASAKKARLPAEYQEVEWIQGDGSAYINTGITPTINSAMEALMAAQSQTNANFLGSREGSSGADRAFLVASYNSAHKFGFMRWGYGVQTIPFDTDWHHYRLSPTEATVDGVSYSLSAPKDQISTREIFLFKDHVVGTTTSPIYIKLKFFKFWDGGTIMAAYIPCYRKSDGEIGMYDVVSNTFHTNAGTGTFTKGGNV